MCHSFFVLHLYCKSIIQKSGDFCAILYVGIAEEDVIVETQAFDPLRVKATPTGRKRASVPAGKSEPAFVFP